MQHISFMSANFVARELGYAMTGGWGQGDQATNTYFSPIATFADRFDALLAEVRGMGFQAIDLWNSHLHWTWATAEHLAIARDLLARHDLTVTSMASGFGATREELEAACAVATAVGAPILGGSCPLLATDRATTSAVLAHYGVRLAIENHPEPTPAAMLSQIGADPDPWIGTAVDTGWYGTHGYDAAQAIRDLGDRVFNVHLKDVATVGGHVSVGLGDGVVPVEGCVRALQDMGYDGAISVEHEPDDRDPTAECIVSRQRLEGWLAAAR